MNKYLFSSIFIFLFAAFSFSISYSKTITINAPVYDILFESNGDTFGQLYFIISSEYLPKNYSNSKNVKFLVNVATEEQCNEDNKCRSRGLTLSWVLHIIKNYLSGDNTWRGTSFQIKIDLQKMEIVDFIFVS
ncbi:MAG: hypothetical protein IKN64_05125 [Desulfovibrio sp.]|nr:hypothetical protein [Desulfovibrio sp.]